MNSEQLEKVMLDRGKSEIAMREWIDSYPGLPALEGEFVSIRDDLTALFEEVINDAKQKDLKIQDYYVDAEFGMKLYSYFRTMSWFSLRLASNDSFWRFLSLKVIPDVVAVRWGKDNEDHYWSIPGRIWLKQLWWYIYLSWMTDDETTKSVVESPNCSTDTILNFVERTGKKGTCVDAYRWIIYCYSRIPQTVITDYKRNRGNDLFRTVMKINTARMMVEEPALCEGGYKGYAKELFADAGIEIDTLITDRNN